MPLSKRILPHGKKALNAQSPNYYISGANYEGDTLTLYVKGASNVTATIPAGANYYTTTGTLDGNNILTGSVAGGGTSWTADLSALAGGGGGTVSPSTQYEIPYYSTTSILSGSSVMVLDASNEELKLTTSTIGGAALRLQNTAATSTANGLEVYNNSTQQVLQVGHNNNTDENYIWGTFDVPLKFATSGTERMRILGGGNVGIGTTSPGKLLHIDSDTTGDVEVLRLENSNASTTSLDSVSQGFRMRRDGDDYSFTAAKITSVKEAGWTSTASTIDASLTFSTLANESSLTEKMRITSAGDVGIGTSAPAEKLSIVGGNLLLGTNAKYIQFVNNGGTQFDALGYDGNNDLVLNTPSDIIFKRNGTQNVRIKSNDDFLVDTDTLYVDASESRVGIGTTTPDAPLHILKAAGGANIVTALKLDPDDATTNSGVSIDFNASTTNTGASLVGSRIIGAREGGNASGFLAFYTSPDATSSVPLERMRITSAGYLGIGTTAPARKLEVNYGASSGYMRIVGQSKSLLIGQDSVGASVYQEDNAPMYFATNDTERMRILADGKVGIGTTAPGYSLVVSGSAPEIQIKGNTPRLRLEDIDTGRSDWNLGLDSAQNGLNFAEVGVADNRLFLAAGGKVGLGTSSPSYELDVSSTDPQIALTDTNGVTYYFMSQSNDFYLHDATAGATRLFIKDGGNVGIGSTAPVAKLEVSGAIALSSGSVTSAPGYTSLWASGSGLYWGDQEVYTNTPGSSEITGGGASERIAYFDGTSSITGTSNFEWDDATLKMTNAGNTAITLLGDANRSGENSHAMAMRGKWNGTAIGTVMIATGPDTTNKDDGQLLFYTANAGTQAERMRIDETGNIGIGTTAPESKLHINGGAYLAQFSRGTGDFTLIQSGDTNNLIFAAGTPASNTEVMTLDSTGVGIGTTTPEALLHVEGTSDLPIAIYSGTADTSYHYKTTGSGDISFQYHVQQGRSADIALINHTTPTEMTTIRQKVIDADNSSILFRTRDGGSLVSPMMISSSNVGIGTITPAYTLDVNGAIHTDQDYYLKRTGGAFYYQNNAGTNLWALYETSGDLAVYDYQGGGAQMVTFKNGGNVGIGTVAPDRKLHLSSAGTTFMKITSDDTQDWSIGANSTAGFTVYDETDGEYRFSIKDGGNVGIGTTAPLKKLDVVGDSSGWPIASLSGSNTHGTGLQLYNSHTTQQDWAIVGGGNNWNYTFRIYDQTEADYRFAIDRDGKIGMGGPGGVAGNATITNPAHTLHIRSLSGVEGLHVSGAANQYTASFRANGTTGQAYGPLIRGGTNSSDAALIVENQAGSSQYLFVRGDGNVGIGTNTPTEHFHVKGSSDVQALFESTTGEVELRFKDTSSTQYLVTEHSVLSLGAQGSVHASNLNLKAGAVGIGTVDPTATRQSEGLTISGTAITDASWTPSDIQRKPTSLFVPSLGSGSYILAAFGGKTNNAGNQRAEPPYMVIGAADQTTLHENAMGSGRAVSLVLAGTAGYNSGGQDYGNFGSLLFHGNTNWSGDARRWMISNAWRNSGAGDMGLGFGSETAGSLDPTISGTTPNIVMSTDSNYGVAGKQGFIVGNKTHIGDGLITSVSTTNPQLTLAYNGSKYTTLKQDGNDFTIKNEGTGDDIIINANDKVQLHAGGINYATTADTAYLYIQPTGTDGDAGANIFNLTAGQNITINSKVDTVFKTNGAEVMRVDATETALGIGTTTPSSRLHVSGGAIQKDLGEVVYLRAVHAGFDQNAIVQHAPNTQYVKAEGASPPGAGAIPTELPLAEAKFAGLEITVMQRWDADPEGALTVQKQAGSADVIYEGGSNTASANVSIATYRGANKTFMIAAAGVWIVKD